MDFIDQIRGVAARIPKQVALLETEEATKNALVMPFIQALGYDVFDPTEVVPEFTADVGTKKGEKVDYAIMVEGQPMLLFECKTARANLAKEHASQLYRYFSVTAAKIGVLTNGVEYWFFSDLDEPNKMDKQPFMVLDMTRLRELFVAELKKLSKSAFNLDGMLSAASELKYSGAIKELLAQQMTQPAEDFVRFFAGHVHPGKRLTAGVMQSFEDLVKRAMKDFVNERVHERLKTALESDQAPALAEESAAEEADNDGVVTTEEERTGFRIVQSIVREVVDASRVTIRDAKSYCSVLLDDNNRKPICRMRFNNPQRLQVGLLDEHKTETRVTLSRLDDLYEHAEQLTATVRHYEDRKSTGESGRIPASAHAVSQPE